jgi:hypothetical protein
MLLADAGRRGIPSAGLSLFLALAPAALAEPQLVATFDDAAGDATGPGSYVPPGDTEFTDGDFDLRRFAVYVDGTDALFAVTLGAAFRRPALTQRANRSEIQLWNDIYLQNIDIYIDTDRTSPAGYSACIPGRRVAFAGGRTWKAAVVLTPQPGPARGITEDALGKAAASHVIFAEGLQIRGRTVTARVPIVLLGGKPSKEWGYSVHVSGAAWERSFAVLDRVRGMRELNAFTMPVLPVPEAWAFGGAPEGNMHPRVVDVLLPAGVDQKAVLGSFDAGSFARVPFVDGSAAPSAAAPPPVAAAVAPPKSGPELSVAYMAGNMISLAGPAAGVKQMQFGRVLGPDGTTVARVVVVQVLEGGLVVSAVENAEKIVKGARVRFDAPQDGR